VNDSELYERSIATLVDSWRYSATGSPGAEVIEADGAWAAVFVNPPERGVLNNAVLARDRTDAQATLDEVERAYGKRGIDRFAVWVHESQRDTARAVVARGYRYDSYTRDMGMALAELAAAQTPELELAEASIADYMRINDLPAGLLPELSERGSHMYLARADGEDAALLIARDHCGDCGIYSLGTRPAARRRGLGTALTAHALAEATERGCTSATLQSTAMAERVYASVGFRDLGRFDEYVPGADRSTGRPAT
jgi:ribosomal protein S18 acetylase RimI-like enzyme